MMQYVAEYNPQVYGVSFNVDNRKYKNHLACCLKLPELDLNFRNYKWIQQEARQYFLDNGIDVLKVKFTGGLHFVRRDVFEKIPYLKVPVIDTRPKSEKEGGYASDLAFAHYCGPPPKS